MSLSLFDPFSISQIEVKYTLNGFILEGKGRVCICVITYKIRNFYNTSIYCCSCIIFLPAQYDSVWRDFKIFTETL